MLLSFAHSPQDGINAQIGFLGKIGWPQLVQSDTLRYEHFCFKPSSEILKYYTFETSNPLNLNIIQ